MSAANLDNVLQMVLSQGNKEQNAMYPPRIYELHFNIVTNFILDEIARVFAETQQVIDIGRPFLKSKEVAVTGGVAKFPEDYRNLLGVGMNVTIDFEQDCGCKDDSVFENDPLARRPELIAKDQKKSKCVSHDVTMVDIDEFGYKTTHPYKRPTYKKPIGCIFTTSEIKVCPFDVSYVEIRYLRKPKTYRYGYKMLPDDTYVFDSTTSEESEWDDTALQHLIKGVNALYAIYTRDGEFQNWNEAIKKVGLF